MTAPLGPPDPQTTGGGTILEELTRPVPTDEGDHHPFGHESRPLLFGIVSVVLLIAFEAMAVATAMPRAVGELHGLPYYAWAFSGYVVTSLFAMVLAGELCDARGP